MIDKRIAHSRKLGAATDPARLLWFMIYPNLDCEGRIEFDDLDDLRLEILPLFRWSLKKIGNALNNLADIGLVILYPNEKRIAIEFNRFGDFQTGLRKEREAPSQIPASGVAPENSGVFRISPALSLSLSLSLSLKKEGRKEEKRLEIIFDFHEGKFINISEEQKTRWKIAYPACNVDLCILQAAEWLISNPSKSKSDYLKFLTNWLKREQDHGGTKGIPITEKKLDPAEFMRRHEADLKR